MQSQFSGDQDANYVGLTFRCYDLGIQECKWQTSGNTEDEVMRHVEEHFREKHGFEFDLATQIAVRQLIRRQAA